MAQGVVPDPASSLGLILQGGQQLGQGIARHQQQGMDNRAIAADKQAKEAELSRPVNPLFQRYFERVMAGEDPDAVANEARQDPAIAEFANNARSGAAPSTPQQVAPPQTLGGAPNTGGFNPVQMAQPTQGAPQVSPQSVGATGQGPAPQQAPQPQQSLGAPQRPGMAPITGRDMQQMGGVLPTMIAAQGRENTARLQTQSKEQIAAQNLMFQFQKLDAQKQAQILQIMAGKEKVAEQGAAARDVATIRAASARDTTATRANASLGVARTNADAKVNVAASKALPKDPTAAERKEMNDELKTQLNTITRLRSVADFDKQPEAQSTIQAAEARVAELRAALGRAVGSTQAPQAAGSPGKLSTFGQSPQPQVGGGKIKVKLNNGKVGKIDPADFNPATMTKL